MTDHIAIGLILLLPATAQASFWFAHRGDNLSFFLAVFFVFLTGSFTIIAVLSAGLAP
jgi:hypothetical protein